MEEKTFNPEELKKLLQNQYGPGVQVEVVSQPQSTGDAAPPPATEPPDLDFDYRPSGIKEYLDRYVIQQDDAKKVLATAICDHYHHIQMERDSDDWRDYKKQNVLLIGPTGVGKTYLIQNIARLIGVPFVKADATKFSETGYVGGDVEDLVRELVSQADGAIELAERGIVYLDEVDKLASPTNSIGRDVSGHGVQRNLLKLMEETDVPLRSPTDVASQMQSFMEFQTKGKIEKQTINTRHILFIVSGAFTGLTEIVKRRIGSKQIGFTGKKTTASEEHFLLERVKSIDFLEYGFEAEFIGRLPVIIHCNDLSVQDLFKVLKYSEGSLLKQYKRDFLAYGIDVYFTDDGMQAVAERAALERTGARGLMSVCEKAFREFKYRLPDSDVREFVVDGPLVEGPLETLELLLANPGLHTARVRQWQVDSVSERLRKDYGVNVAFAPQATELLGAEADAAELTLLEHCDAKFADFAHGLTLLGQKASDREFELTGEGAEDLSATLEKWIKESYAG